MSSIISFGEHDKRHCFRSYDFDLLIERVKRHACDLAAVKYVENRTAFQTLALFRCENDKAMDIVVWTALRLALEEILSADRSGLFVPEIPPDYPGIRESLTDLYHDLIAHRPDFE